MKNYGNLCFNYIEPKESGYIYCMITCGDAMMHLRYYIDLYNDFDVTDAYSESSDSHKQKAEICKGNQATFEFLVSGYNLDGLTLKTKKIYGKNFKYRFGAFSDGYKTLYIKYIPTYEKESAFDITDKFGDTVSIKTLSVIKDHKYVESGIIKEATALQTGKKIYVCTVCSKETTKTVPKLKATISIPKSYKLRVGKKEQIKVKLTKGDYITSVTAKKNKIVKLYKNSNSFWVKGLKTGTINVTVKTKAGKTATCKIIVKKK